MRAYYTQQGRAHNLTRKAVRNGDLIDPRTLLCIDCGHWAEVYDHRKYSEPLVVEPVCQSCNCKRGPAVDSPAVLRVVK